MVFRFSQDSATDVVLSAEGDFRADPKLDQHEAVSDGQRCVYNVKSAGCLCQQGSLQPVQHIQREGCVELTSLTFWKITVGGRG